jgi:hypothetical protein
MLAEFIKSRLLGSPVELFRFSFGPRPQDTHLYTDSETPVIYDGETYSPMPLQRGPTSNSGTLDKTVLDITMPHLARVPQLFRIYPPSFTIGLTVLQGQSRDPDAEFVAIWVGRVISVSFEGIEAKLSCEPISTSFRRSGLRRNYQYMCPHVLYGPQCLASKVDATTPATVSAVSGRSVTLTSLLSLPGRYAGGMVEWITAGGLNESRTILTVDTVGGVSVLGLTGLPSGLVAGGSISAVLGCRHTLVSCRDDHDNAVNYGGHPWIPLKNPIGNVSPFE